MNSEEKTYLPENFVTYFQEYFRKINPNASVYQDDQFFQNIYKTILNEDPTKNGLNQSEMALVGISDSENDMVMSQFQFFRKIIKNLGNLLSGKKFKPQALRQIAFKVFIYKDFLSDKLMLSYLQEQFCLEIDQEGKFISKISKLGDNLSFEEYKELVAQIFSEFITKFWNTAKQSVRKSLNKFFFERNQSLQKVKEQLLLVFQEEKIEQIINNLYENIVVKEKNSTPQSTIEPYTQFKARVFSLLSKQCRQVQKELFQQEQLQKIIKDLYGQAQEKNKSLIVRILKTSGLNEFKQKANKPYTVPLEFILKAFKLKDQSELKIQMGSDQQNNPEATRASQMKKSEIKNFRQSEIKIWDQQPSGSYILNSKINSESKMNNKSQINKKSKISEQDSYQESQASQIADEAKKINQESQKLLELHHEVSDIQKSAKTRDCLEIYLRELQMAGIMDKLTQVRQNSEKIKAAVLKYDLGQFLIAEINEIKLDSFSKSDRIAKIIALRRKIQFLNLEEVISTKKRIQGMKQCVQGIAVITVGKTGVGKTTLINGMSGHGMQFNKTTNDYQPTDPEMASRFKVSNNTMSVTKQANISVIPKDWSDGEIIILIDTPGLGDNRGPQTDITNNLSTMKLFKKLKSARIIIAISGHQFGDRWYQNLKSFIKLLAKYLVNIKDFSSSMTFVLSKGLTAKKFTYELNEFISCKMYASENWTKNQKEFIQIMKNKTQKLSKICQIHDPSEHDYYELTQKVLQTQQIERPGDSLSSSFSQQALEFIRNTYIYLNKMVRNTFELGQFSLTQFYLRQIKQLDEISESKQYDGCLDAIKSKLDSKVIKSQHLLKRFISHNEIENLQEIKTTKEFFDKKQSESIYDLLYKQGQATPNSIFNKLIHKNINQALVWFESPSKIQKEKRKIAVSCLSLIRQFRSKIEYQEIKNRIQNQNSQILNKIKNALRQVEFKQSEWKTLTQSYSNQFTLDSIVINQLDYIEKIKQIVLEYINSNPEQVQQIQKLLDFAKKQILNGQLLRVSEAFLTKLTKIKESHYLLKQFVEPKIKSILLKLQELNAFFQTQKQKNQRSDNIPIDLWEIYMRNQKEVYQVLAKFDTSLMRRFTNHKQEESTLNSVLINLTEKISQLEKDLDLLSLSPQSIDAPTINQKLKVIFKLISFIRKRKDYINTNDPQNTSQAQILNQALKNAQITVQRIIRKIDRTTSINKIENFQVNFKLIVCLLVLKQFSTFVQDQKNQVFIKKIQENIIKKLMQPLNGIEQIQFGNEYDYEKLYKVLRYMKSLDEKAKQILINAQGFDLNVDFSQNLKIKNLLQRCFERIKSDYLEFKSIIELTTLKMKQEHNENQYTKRKQLCISGLSLDLHNKAIEYIKSFQNVRKIVQEFSNVQLVEDFKNTVLNKQDLKITIIQRINVLQTQLSDQIVNKTFTRKHLSQIQREVKFLLRVHEKTKFQTNQNAFEGVIKQLNILIGIHLKDFDQMLQYCQQIYKQVINGVELEILRDLLKHECADYGPNKLKINSLMKNIDTQYKNILMGIFIDFDPYGAISEKTNIFLNTYEFIKISDNYSYLYTFDKSLLQKNLGNFFRQLSRGFQTIVKQVAKGTPLNKNEVNRLVRIQKRVLMCLPNEYAAFKKTISLDEDFSQLFEKQCKEANVNLYKKYMTGNCVIDDGFSEVYKNTTAENKQKMEEAVIQKNNASYEQLNSLLKEDHGKFEEKLEKIQEEITKRLPEQLANKVGKKFTQAIKIKNEEQNKSKQISLSSKQQKNPINIINEFSRGSKINSKNMKSGAKEVFQSYFNDEAKQLDFNNIKKATQILERNLKLFEDKAFKDSSQKDNFFVNIETKFIVQVRAEVEEKNNFIKQELVNFKKQLSQLNPSQNFKLHSFKELKNDVTTKAFEMMQLTENFSEFFKDQNFQLVSMLQEQILENTSKLTQQIKVLQEFKLKFSQKQSVVKKQFVQNLRVAHTSRFTCDSLKNFNKVKKIKNKIIESDITAYDGLIKNIKKDFKLKYDEANKWNLEQSLTNDALQRIAKRNEQAERDLVLLDNFVEVFFSKDQIPQKPLQQIQKRNQTQFNKFQQKVLQTVDAAFESQKQVESSLARRYYDFLKLFSENSKSETFPSTMKITDVVKETIGKKMKANTKRIEHFSCNEQSIKKFNQFISEFNNFTEQEKKKKQQTKKQFRIKNLQFQTQHQANFLVKLKIIPQDQKKAQKVQSLKKQFATDKQSKINGFNTALEGKLKQIEAKMSKQKQKLTESIQVFIHQGLTSLLIINRRSRSYFSCEQQIKSFNVSIENLLDKIQQSYSKKISKYLYNSLKQSNNPYSHILIQEQKMFKTFRATRFQEETQGKTFSVLLDSMNDMQNNKEKKTRMIDRYTLYDAKYNSVLENYKNSNDFAQTKKRILDQTIVLGQKIRKGYQGEQRQGLRWELLGYVFALWTIIKSQFDQDGNVMYIHKPHSGQILAIFLLLQFDEKQISSKISKTMVQVSTGEGKSVILGSLAAYLALVGFKVYEACYSQYLSLRDYNDLVELFTVLNVKDRIHYNIFPEICKMMLDQSPQKPFTGKVQKFIVNQGIWSTVSNYFKSLLPDTSKNNSILLIDEADVFLDENYLGENYYPAIRIQKESIRSLLDYVWSRRKTLQTLTPDLIINSQEFKAVCKDINNQTFGQIMKNQTHAMIRGLAKYQTDVYTVLNGKIYYKEGDGLSDKIHFGYRTIFSYYHEYEVNGRVSNNQLNKQIAVNLIVASFSYSKLPSYFKSILGVTGTLESMSTGQKQILTKQFGVQKRFIQPSIYPESRRKVTFKRCSNLALHEEIVKNIDEEHAKKRPILVFFKTKSEAYDFFDSPFFAKYLNIGSIITYEVLPEDRDFRIQVSTLESKITILTFDFSRGTDFKMKTKNSAQHPGLHVISSFLPNSFSDYIQLIGRTGRQGRQGSSLLLIPEDRKVPQNEQDLKKQQAQKIIRDKDNIYWESKREQIRLKMKQADQIHEKNTLIYSSGATTDKIFKNLLKLNYQQPLVLTKATCKCTICIDATGSMAAVFPKVIQVALNAMPDIYQTIKKANLAGSFELKFVGYRNYNSDSSMILQYSNFQSKCESLVQWLKTIKVSGGCGNQALQVCLQHLNSLPDLNQFLIISDARANTLDDTKNKRASRGQKYWNQKGFLFTDYETQINKLISKKVKGYSYYLNGNSTRAFYDQMSKRTGAESKQFKIESSDATKEFASYVAKMILTGITEMVGGSLDKALNIYAQIASKKTYV